VFLRLRRAANLQSFDRNPLACMTLLRKPYLPLTTSP